MHLYGNMFVARHELTFVTSLKPRLLCLPPLSRTSAHMVSLTSRYLFVSRMFSLVLGYIYGANGENYMPKVTELTCWPPPLKFISSTRSTSRRRSVLDRIGQNRPCHTPNTGAEFSAYLKFLYKQQTPFGIIADKIHDTVSLCDSML